MAFSFRKFTIEDKQSTLRVGTDAMLIGSWANPGMAKTILDVGTGCGVLALMMAQKSEALIEAVEIDQPSVDEARANFYSSPWPERITSVHDSLQAFTCKTRTIFDFIITNPPYFSNSLKSPSERVNLARHDDKLSLTELVRLSYILLAPAGCLAIILPVEQADRFQAICAENRLFPSRSMVVYPKYGLPPKRTLMEFTRHTCTQPLTSELTILDRTGKYTSEYLALTDCFHNF
ncbi:MAG: methyltransferase [Bacteroidetes bacterium]|nr:methyltransferase [Bacteroidota bacterium]